LEPRSQTAPRLFTSSEGRGAYVAFQECTRVRKEMKTMLAPHMPSRLIAAFTLVALAAGCAGGAPVSPQMPAAKAPFAFAGPLAQHYGDDWMFTAQLYGDDLGVYQRNKNGFGLTLKKTLTTGISLPQGMMSTVNGWWYVANGGHSNVLVYQVKKNAGPPDSPSATLDDYGQVPVNVAVTPNRNLVAVSNGTSASSGAGSVSVYLKRQAEPSRTLTYGSDVLAGQGVAIDHQGNCYWSFNDPNTNSGSIVEFAKCNGSGSPVVTGIGEAGGIVFDQSGDLYYVDESKGVYACKKTSHCVLTYANGPSGFGLPTNINFDYKSKDLWVADATGYIWAIEIRTGYMFRTPSLDGDPYGIAPDPGS